MQGKCLYRKPNSPKAVVENLEKNKATFDAEHLLYYKNLVLGSWWLHLHTTTIYVSVYMQWYAKDTQLFINSCQSLSCHTGHPRNSENCRNTFQFTLKSLSWIQKGTLWPSAKLWQLIKMKLFGKFLKLLQNTFRKCWKSFLIAGVVRRF